MFIRAWKVETARNYFRGFLVGSINEKGQTKHYTNVIGNQYTSANGELPDRFGIESARYDH